MASIIDFTGTARAWRTKLHAIFRASRRIEDFEGFRWPNVSLRYTSSNFCHSKNTVSSGRENPYRSSRHNHTTRTRGLQLSGRLPSGYWAESWIAEDPAISNTPVHGLSSAQCTTHHGKGRWIKLDEEAGNAHAIKTKVVTPRGSRIMILIHDTLVEIWCHECMWGRRDASPTYCKRRLIGPGT